jgi:hypothetical protein
MVANFDVDSGLGTLHGVNVGSVANVPTFQKKHAASRVEERDCAHRKPEEPPESTRCKYPRAK